MAEHAPLCCFSVTWRSAGFFSMCVLLTSGDVKESQAKEGRFIASIMQVITGSNFFHRRNSNL